jgi:hypothetical protein
MIDKKSKIFDIETVRKSGPMEKAMMSQSQREKSSRGRGGPHILVVQSSLRIRSALSAGKVNGIF